MKHFVNKNWILVIILLFPVLAIHNFHAIDRTRPIEVNHRFSRLELIGEIDYLRNTGDGVIISVQDDLKRYSFFPVKRVSFVENVNKGDFIIKEKDSWNIIIKNYTGQKQYKLRKI